MPRLLPRRALLALALASSAAACGDDTPTTPSQNIVQLAQANANLSTLAGAIQSASLAPTLSGSGPFTVFAPVNSAFAAIPADVLTRLTATGNVAILSKVLRYHVVPGRILASQLTEGQTLTTVEGTTIRVTLAGGARVNNARITQTDITASNGVIHLIDGVLTESLDIVDVATIRGFSQLVTAVGSAGLVDALRGNGAGQGLTVFAPTDAAFAALTSVPPNLAQVLQYHVVAGRAPAASLSNGQRLTTLQGGQLTVNIAGSTVRLQGARNTVNVTATDVPAKNGIIHVIDAVLLP